MTRTTIDKVLPPGQLTPEQDRLNEADAERSLRLDLRSHTSRIRAALRDLPSDTDQYLKYRKTDPNTDWEDALIEDLQEIIGSATHIADALGVEL
jgi:hypothetical protein